MSRPEITGAGGVSGLSQTQRIEHACLVLEHRHDALVLQRMRSQLGERGLRIGAPDMSRNPLRTFVARVNRSRSVPPLVSGLEPGLAAMLGDYTSTVLQERYRAAGGWPMPSSMVDAASNASRFRIGSGSAGVLLSWSDQRQGVVLDYIRPSELRVEFGADDPEEPTVIRHLRLRAVPEGGARRLWDVYDLRDPKAPRFTIQTEDGAEMKLQELLAPEDLERMQADPWWWRDAEGRPFHRIVVTGRPEWVWNEWQRVEASIMVCVHWTHWGAAILDAGHPQRVTIGLRFVGTGSEGGEQGGSAGPEDILHLESVNPDKPGQIDQWGPGFDPEVTGRAIGSWEARAMSALGLGHDMHATGGDPAALERAELDRRMALELPRDRRLDGEILRRAALMANKATAGTARRTSFAADYGVLYGDEVAAMLPTVETEE